MDFIDSLATETVQMESGNHQVSKLHQILRNPGWFLRISWGFPVGKGPIGRGVIPGGFYNM